MLLRLLKDRSGAAAAEYALILAVIGGSIVLASQALGGAIQRAGEIQTIGPGGTAYRCTSNCQYDYKDYCALVSHKNDASPPVTVPALPSGAKCDGETALS